MMLCGGILLLFNLGEIGVGLDREHQQKTGPYTKNKKTTEKKQLQSAADDGMVWRTMVIDVCPRYRSSTWW